MEQDLFDFDQQLGTPEPLPTHNAPSVRLPGRDGTEESGPPSLAPVSFDFDEPVVLDHVPAHGEGPERLQESGIDHVVQTVREGSIPSLAHSTWREVPAALFLSWSAARQFAYCAARDEDAALHADFAIEAAWYRERALAYRKSATHNFSKK